MLKELADEMERGWLPYGEKSRLERMSKTDPTTELDVLQVEQAWGVHVSDLHRALPHGDYYQKVYRQHGIGPFVQRPATLVGTIHASKGREADTVHLIESWGTLPYRSIYNGQHEAESCVAYVALTRHRSQLILEPASEGSPYPGL
jgi:superfamily I DNA/RNA helicase